MTRLLFRLRVEEALALVFLLPTTYLTAVANVYAARQGLLGARHPGGLLRLGVAVALLALLAAALELRPRSPAVLAAREVLPVLTCLLIYTNLHDTIGFVNSHDIHHFLIGLDQAIFGVQPCVWAERLITPRRTEVMSLFYMSFLWIAPSVSFVLLAQQRWRDFRTTTLGVLVCFFLGYALYVVFPAAPPRLVLVYDFHTNLYGYAHAFSSFEARAFELLPADSRAAFPSLHAAVSLVVLVYAWRFLRAWAWILLPFVLGLWASTIYLRHHYFVDLVAGWLLAPVAIGLAPKLDRWWARQQRSRGIAPARGADEAELGAGAPLPAETAATSRPA
jgi:membrane-associated phospholipid phosphatase